MKKVNLLSLFLAPFAAILLLFTVSPGNMASAPMSDMPTTTENSAQCQSACPALPASAKKEEIDEIKDTDPDPAPALPYYANFINLVYLAPVLLGAYLLNLARKWQPPDLVVLYSNYQN